MANKEVTKSNELLDKALDFIVETQEENDIKAMRCKKLGGREVPRSCHVLNGRKGYCKDLFVTDRKSVIKDNWL